MKQLTKLLGLEPEFLGAATHARAIFLRAPDSWSVLPAKRQPADLGQRHRFLGGMERIRMARRGRDPPGNLLFTHRVGVLTGVMQVLVQLVISIAPSRPPMRSGSQSHSASKPW